MNEVVEHPPLSDNDAPIRVPPSFELAETRRHAAVRARFDHAIGHLPLERLNALGHEVSKIVPLQGKITEKNPREPSDFSHTEQQ